MNEVAYVRPHSARGLLAAHVASPRTQSHPTGHYGGLGAYRQRSPVPCPPAPKGFLGLAESAAAAAAFFERICDFAFCVLFGELQLENRTFPSPNGTPQGVPINF